MRKAVAIVCGGLLLAAVAVAWVVLRPERVATPREAAPGRLEPAPPPAEPGFLHGRADAPLPLVSDPPSVLEEVRETLASTYYRFIPDSVLEQPSIERMLAELDDPYTEYLDPLELQLFREQLAQTYFGVGLTVGPGEGGLIVTSSRSGPAREAGIRPGDIIISIDGQAAAKLPFDRSAALIKGEEGSVVRLTVRRPGKRRPIEFTVVRHEIDVPVVQSRLLSAKGRRIGYIRVLVFREDVATSVAAATRGLVLRGADGLILDLRGDPGGLLSQAVEVTSVFLEDGRVCSISGLHRAQSYFVSGDAVETKRPLAVLVDGATASAAEIVAAALTDNGRALVVGQRTYGKAAVQTVVPLSNGAALKLTTATYLTPAGASIRETGIRPDVRAADDPLTRPDEAVAAARDAVLKRL
jgi:carboxyl-terminal processing protease